MDQKICDIWVCEDCMLKSPLVWCSTCHTEDGREEEPWSLVREGQHVTMGNDIITDSVFICRGCDAWVHGSQYLFILWETSEI